MDISQRALAVLANVDRIAVEDTRHSAKLLQHYSLQKPMMAVHQHNEAAVIDKILSFLEDGEAIALISDAGTPLISDPGYALVQQVREHGYSIVPIPGPCALIAGLSASGLATDKFVFEGFLPVKAGKRNARLQMLKHETRTLVVYETPHRIVDLLSELADVFGPQRQVVIGRELTKTFETFYQGDAEQLAERCRGDANMQRGELVVMIAGAPERDEEALDAVEMERVLKLCLTELPHNAAAKLTAKILKTHKNRIYQLGLSLNAE